MSTAILCPNTGPSAPTEGSIHARSNLSVICSSLLLLTIGSAWGQTSDVTGTQATVLEEIVVTARKRAESLVDIPVTLTAFSDKDIISLGIVNLEDISAFSPGLFFSKQGDQRGGRSESIVRFRGMSINDISPVRQLASVFEDGVYVSGGLAAISMEDVERIEVIKGPQSAYFGRSTFGGAVNFITWRPGTDEFTGQASMKLSEGNEYVGSLSLNVPLIDDRLAARFTGRLYSTDGRFTSLADGGALGAEETRSAALTLAVTPNDNFDMKFRAFYAKDDDGLSPTFAVGPNYYNCGPFFQGGKRFICGTVPVEDAISLNTQLGPTAVDVFVNNSVDSSTIADSPLPLNHLGMERETTRMSLAGNWDIGDSPYSMSFVLASNSLEQMRMTDTDHTGQQVWQEANFQDIADSSAEVRFAFGADRFSWMLGVNYFDLEYRAPTGATVGWLYPNSFASNGFFFDQTVSVVDVGTLGVFGSVTYQLSDTVNMSLETRYQSDKIEETAPRVALSETYTNFLPRAILQWQPTDATNLYLTFARGNMPGNFNGNVSQFNEQQRQQIKDQTGATEIVNEAELDNYELGLKQSFLGGQAFVSAATYFMKWTNQQNRSIAVIDDPTTPAGIRTVPVVLSNAQTDLWGLELESKLAVGEHWSFRGTYNWAASEIQEFACDLCFRVLGTTDVAGHESARFPEHSGSLGAAYDVNMNGEIDWFARADAIYTGSAWSEVLNLAKSPDYWTFNLRFGLQSPKWRLEAFALNALDDEHYSGIARSADFAKGTFDITDFVVNVTPTQPRQFGIHGTWFF